MIIPNKDDFYLIQDILKRNYFNFFKNGEKNIELILNHSCNKNCTNCFSCSYDKEIYKNQDIYVPTNSNKYENLLDIIDWYILNNFSCNIYFRGCIEEENSEQLLSILKNIKNKFLLNNIFPKQILFETKGLDINLLKSILKIFNKEIPIIFIFNINGPYCDNNNEKEYQECIEFIINNEVIIDAKINAINVKYWIKNYKWWIINLGFDNLNKLHLSETLDSNWDPGSLQNYIKFLDFQIDILSESLQDFKSYIFQNKLNFTTVQIIDQEFLTNNKYYQSCLFHSGLAIDLITLKIPACTKLNYPIFHVGEFKKEENNLIIYPINISILIAKSHLKKSCTPHCEYCNFLNICEKTCYGENFKVSYNPICPIKNSCDMIQVKYNFLFFKYNNMNLLNLKEYNLNQTFYNDLKNLIKNIQQEEE